jgi:hypothetical protein
MISGPRDGIQVLGPDHHPKEPNTPDTWADSFIARVTSWSPHAQLDQVANVPIAGGLNDSDSTPHLGKRPGTPLGDHLAGPIVVTNHGAVRIRNVAE